MTGKDGYFLAKREMVAALDRRAEKYAEEARVAESAEDEKAVLAAKSKQHATETFRSFVRNVMLWDTNND